MTELAIRGALIWAVVLLAACESLSPSATSPSATSPSATIVGEITDTDIEVNVTAAPWSVWVEFTNVGSKPCALMEIVTEIPLDKLPLYPDGTLNMEGTAEQPGLGPGSFTDSGDVVAQGRTFRWHEPSLDVEGAYLAGPRIFLCNGPGDYEAGRYTVVEIEPTFGSPPSP